MKYNNEMATYYLDGAMYAKAQADLDAAQANLNNMSKECRKCGTPIIEGEKCERDLV